MIVIHFLEIKQRYVNHNSVLNIIPLYFRIKKKYLYGDSRFSMIQTRRGKG